MSALKEKLEAAINAWEESHVQQEKQMEQPKDHLFKTTNNVTRSTFNAVRDNPGCKRKTILAGLETHGYKLASTTSILSQMIKQRLVREESDGKLYANFEEYVPLKGTSKPKTKVKTQAKLKAVPTPKQEVKPKYSPIEAAPHKQERRVIDIEEWLNEVPLMQARMVYMRLKTIFEGEANA
jgi:hypothetical protein